MLARLAHCLIIFKSVVVIVNALVEITISLSLNGFNNKNNNLCISGVMGWVFNLHRGLHQTFLLHVFAS